MTEETSHAHTHQTLHFQLYYSSSDDIAKLTTIHCTTLLKKKPFFHFCRFFCSTVFRFFDRKIERENTTHLRKLKIFLCIGLSRDAAYINHFKIRWISKWMNDPKMKEEKRKSTLGFCPHTKIYMCIFNIQKERALSDQFNIYTNISFKWLCCLPAFVRLCREYFFFSFRRRRSRCNRTRSHSSR